MRRAVRSLTFASLAVSPLSLFLTVEDLRTLYAESAPSDQFRGGLTLLVLPAVLGQVARTVVNLGPVQWALGGLGWSAASQIPTSPTRERIH